MSRFYHFTKIDLLESLFSHTYIFLNFYKSQEQEKSDRYFAYAGEFTDRQNLQMNLSKYFPTEKKTQKYIKKTIRKRREKHKK